MTLEAIVEGGTHSYVWREEGYMLSVQRFKESGGELHAEVTGYLLEPGGTPSHLRTDKVQLISARSRDSFAKTLAARAGRSHTGTPINWGDALEAACVRSMRTFRQGPPLLTLADVEAPSTLPYLVGKLLPESDTGVLFGDGEAGKSMFALFVAVAVATGQALPNGLRPERPANVLYLDWESTDPTEHARRLRRVAAGMGVAVPRNIVYRQCFRPITEEADLLATEVSKRNIELIIVDSLAPACGGDPSDAKDAVAAMNALRQLGGTRLAIGHVNRVDREKPQNGQTIFGSIFWRNMTRSMWQLVAAEATGNDDQVEFALYQRKSNNDKRERWPLGFRYQFSPGGGPISIHSVEINASSDLAESLTLSQRLQRALATGAKDINALTAATNATVDAIRKQVSRSDGKFINLNANVRTPDGKQVPALYGLRAQEEGSREPYDIEGPCWRCGGPFSGWEGPSKPICEAHLSVIKAAV